MQAELCGGAIAQVEAGAALTSASAVTCESDELWDALVCATPSQDVYFRPGYARAYEHAAASDSVAVIVSAGDSKFLVPLQVRPLSQLDFAHGLDGYDAITPYGYGGILRCFGQEAVTAQTIEQFCAALKLWCLRNSIVSILIRLHPLMEQTSWFESAPDGVSLVPCGPTVGLDLEAWDDERGRLKGLTKGRRSDLNVARRGLRLTWASDQPKAMEAYLGDFRLIYENRMRELGADKAYFFPPEYYAALASGLGDRLDVALAWCGNQLVGGAIYMAGRQFAHYHLSGTNEMGRSHRANTLMINEAVRWGRRHGCRWLHLGGGKTGDNALFEYKKSFGGSLFDYSFVGLIADRDRYAELTAMRASREDLGPCRADYFPRYRS